MPKMKQDPFMSGWFDPIAYENMLKAIPPPRKPKLPPSIMKHVTMVPSTSNHPPRADFHDDTMSDDPPMSGPSDDLPKICVKKGCKTLLVGPDARWKQCPKCRREAREWQRKRRENKDKDLPSANGKWVVRESSDDEQVIGMLSRPAMPTKEELWKRMKPEERFREWMDQVKASGKLQDGQDVVMGRRKVGVLAEKQGVLKKTKPDNVYPEYMSAFDLCAALTKCIANAAPRPTNFRGCYCVVEAEATPITRDRALDEADKVRELAFGDFWDVDMPPVSVFKANGHHGRRVDCECLCSPDRTNKCGGTLTVKVLKVFDDVFPGEKIIVKMTHDD